MTPTQYTPDFEIAIKILLTQEGGYIDNPGDSGGVTNMGITKKSLAEYNQKHGYLWTVPTLSKDQAREFYFDEYWVPLRLHDFISQDLKNVVLSIAVNRGKFAAIHSLQVCAKMPKDAQDGQMGQKTVAYVNAEVDQNWLVNCYVQTHAEAYERLVKLWYVKDKTFGWRPVTPDTKGAVQKNKVFEKGWLKRINSFQIS